MIIIDEFRRTFCLDRTAACCCWVCLSRVSFEHKINEADATLVRRAEFAIFAAVSSNSEGTTNESAGVTGSQSAFEKWSGHVVPKCCRKGGRLGNDFKRQRILK